VTLENGKTFTIEANGNSKDNLYIQSAKLNGRTTQKTYLEHDQILKGGTLEFKMGPEPNVNWGVGADSVPYSMSREMK
jgi:putative alpha-1,2-mannosidase